MGKTCWLVLICLCSEYVWAHEGHKPLPTRGMEVNTETGKMVLTRSARTILDVQTDEVRPQTVSQSLLAYGTLVSPWNHHALVSSPLSGRIVELLVTPGETVKAGKRNADPRPRRTGAHCRRQRRRRAVAGRT